MRYPIVVLVLFYLFKCNCVQGQDSTNTFSSSSDSPISYWFYLDTYYGYNFNDPPSRVVGELVNGGSFIYSHNRHNEFNLNNGIVDVKYSKDRVRAALGLQAGTYVVSNYSSEPEMLRTIFESYIGYKLGKNLWLDAGIFTAHLGFESPVSYDCATLTRSMMADNSPYYESGVKLSYEPTDKLLLSALVLNGWQNIIDRNKNKALGTQLQYKPTTRFLFNWSTFYGKEASAFENITLVSNTDSLSTTRFFNNFYSISKINKRITILAAFDIGIQKRRVQSGYYTWLSPNIILKYTLSDKAALAARVEYFQDKDGVIIYSGTPNGFQTFAASLNFDYKLTDILLWRIEGKVFDSKNRIFVYNERTDSKSILLISSLAIKF